MKTLKIFLNVLLKEKVWNNVYLIGGVPNTYNREYGTKLETDFNSIYSTSNQIKKTTHIIG